MKLPITLYTKATCKYCVLAKKFLDEQRCSYKEVKIGEDITVDEVKALFPGAKTVPVVVVDALWIGGYEDLLKFWKDNGYELL